jgi:hypothetical protein
MDRRKNANAASPIKIPTSFKHSNKHPLILSPGVNFEKSGCCSKAIPQQPDGGAGWWLLLTPQSPVRPRIGSVIGLHHADQLRSLSQPIKRAEVQSASSGYRRAQ